MHIDAVNAFVTIADLGGFTRASEALHISQPALSRQIMELEGELGARLFDRAPNRLALTDAGRRCYLHARELLEKAKELEEEATLGGGKRLAIWFPPTMEYQSIRVVCRLRLYFPDVEVYGSSSSDSSTEDYLNANNFDIFIVPENAILPNAGMKYLQLVQSNMCLLVPLGHRLEYDNSISLKEIPSGNILYFGTPGMRQKEKLIREALQSHGVVPTLVRVKDVTDMIRAIANNRGVAFLPSTMRGVVPPEIRFLDIVDWPYTENRIIAWREDLENSLILRAVKLIRIWFKEFEG